MRGTDVVGRGHRGGAPARRRGRSRRSTTAPRRSPALEPERDRRRAGRLLRGARAPRRPRGRARAARRARPALAPGQRPPRAALAGPEPRPAAVPRRARQHPRAPRPLVAATVRRLPRPDGSRWSRSGARCPGRWRSAGPRRERSAPVGRLGAGAPRDARDRRARDRLGGGDPHDGLGPARPFRRGPGARGRASDDRPLALGDRRRRLDRRPLLLGQVARDGGDLDPALPADRRHRRARARRATPPPRPPVPSEPRWVPDDEAP